MSRVSQLLEEIAGRTGNLLRRVGDGFVTRYRTGSGGLRNTATGLTGADQGNAPRFTWERASRIAWTTSAGLWGYQILASDSAEQAGPPSDGPVQEADSLVAMSPTLAKTLRDLEADGWIIQWGPKGSGYYAVREQKLINIDITAKGGHLLLIDCLAHEAGHARKSDVPISIRPPTKDMTREQWIKEHLYDSFVDEAEAELMSAQVRREILDNGGPDIRHIDSDSDSMRFAVEIAYNRYASGDISRQEARLIIADSINHPETGWYQEYHPFFQKLSDDYFGK
ncbi:hypothetical protein [Nocardia otitidiscaviarum]|uniref:hypothetical protein n=1 Tax=Nocardia otitidiscaviarum TaxID=1823 RepID=UPI001893F1BA|nr:hypothetical protein [Nocardia otitidiscaviarum]MBF6180728.1 hypothetical protein [Nocardia otitidiscaviarum]